MLELATPISELFRDDEAAKKIILASDSLECRNRCIQCDYPKQRLVHFDVNIIHTLSQKEKEYVYSTILSKPELKLVTFHMASSYDKVTVKDDMYQPQGRAYTRRNLLQNAKGNITWLRSFIREDIAMGVENNNYYPTPAYRYVTEGDFITQVVKENSIYFVFDIAHAHITAYNRGILYEDYRSSLPLQRTIQLHISKYGISKRNIAKDNHRLPDKSIFQEVSWIVRRFPVKYLTVEYYKEIKGLLGLLKTYGAIKN